MTDTPKLLPCPFCGGEAKVKGSATIKGAFIAQCKNGHTNGMIYSDREGAGEEWNCRTLPPAASPE